MNTLLALARTPLLTFFVLLQTLSNISCNPSEEVSVEKRQVKAPPTTFVDTPLEIKATPGSDIILPCSLENVGVKTVEWRKTDESDPITVGLMILTDEYWHYDLRWNSLNAYEEWGLQIKNVQKADAGSFTCEILGSDLSREIVLTVEDGPAVTQHAPSKNSKEGSDKCFDEYSCGSGGKCVYLDWCCDGIRDCANGADEDGC